MGQIEKNEGKGGFTMEEKVVFKIWDMPPDLARELISFAKEKGQGKVWMAIKILLDNQKERVSMDELGQIRERLDKIESLMDMSKIESKPPQAEPVDRPKVFGGK